MNANEQHATEVNKGSSFQRRGLVIAAAIIVAILGGIWVGSQTRGPADKKVSSPDFSEFPDISDPHSSHGVLKLPKHGQVMADVDLSPIGRRKIEHEIRAVGKVQYNERGLATITARVDGYIERLFVDFTGIEVKKGDHLVEIYSPELVVAQHEMLTNPALGVSVVEAVKLKLKRWELTDAQIEEIARTRKVQERVTLVSPVAGTVVEKMIVQKQAVKAGDVLYRIANLDSVWVYLDLYEHEIGLVRYGQDVEVRSEAWPNEPLKGRVWFINPVLNEETRTVKVLVNIANTDKRLKPGMFVSAIIRAPILASGKLGSTGVEGKWTCAMHPQILENTPGECSICKMPLTQIPPADAVRESDSVGPLAVPASAVLDSGVRKIVFLETEPGSFAPVEVKLGPKAGEVYPVVSGLKEGDRVAVRGGFLLDSQFQIQGLPSLFNPEGQAGGSTGHQHGGSSPPSTRPPVRPVPKEPEPTVHKH